MQDLFYKTSGQICFSPKQRGGFRIPHFDRRLPHVRRTLVLIFALPSAESNKIVPSVYRTVIEDVIASIRSDFDEYGVEEELVDYLQETWEHNLRQTRVAQFAPAEDDEDEDEDEEMDDPQQQQGQSSRGNAYAGNGRPAGGRADSGEVMEIPRPGAGGQARPGQQQQVNGGQMRQQQQYLQQQMHQMQMAQRGQPSSQAQQQFRPLPGTQQHMQLQQAARAAYLQSQQGGGTQQMGLRGGSSTDEGEDVIRLRGGAGGNLRVKKEEEQEDDRKPSIASASSRNSELKPDIKPQIEPRTGNQSTAGSATSAQDRKPNVQHFKGEANAFGIRPGEEQINSDLDDTDEEDEDDDADEEEGADVDDQANMVYCIYDKVHHQKNKWKVTLRDGLIRANGKEYLFAKCTGEFEW